MIGSLLVAVRRMLRLPEDPRPPAGSPGSVAVFRADRNFYRYSLARWGVSQIGVVAGFVFVFAFGHAMLGLVPLDSDEGTRFVEKIPRPFVRTAEAFRLIRERRPDGVSRADAEWAGELRYEFGPGLQALEVLGVGLFLLQLPLGYALRRLDYELRWYIVTDRSLRVREGVTRLRESTLTFENVQNLAIAQGPLQRMLGIADLRVRTAGGGAGGSEQEKDGSGTGTGDAESMHVVTLRGVRDAATLRDTILDRVRDRVRGETAGPAPSGPSASDPALAAAARVLDEARRLRQSAATTT